MLNDLFSWISSDESATLLTHKMVSPVALKSAQAQADDLQKKMVADIRISMFTQTSTLVKENLTIQNKKLESHQLYVSFLAFCLKKMGSKEQYPLFYLGLEYLLETPQDHLSNIEYEKKLFKIFKHLMACDPGLARSFYQEKLLALSKVSSIKTLIDKLEVEKMLEKFSQIFSEQKKPLGILGLLQQYSDDPHQLTAVLLWLVKNKVSAQDIIKTGLIQRFVGYHFSFMYEEESPIRCLYQLLAEFPEAGDLVTAAKKVRYEERGLQSYNLAAEFCPQQNLISLPVQEFMLEFTASSKNFQLLWQNFGMSFLLYATMWGIKTQYQTDWTIELSKMVNTTLTSQQLSTFINGIFAVQKNPESLAYFSSLLNEKTVQKLIEINQGSVLHLLPYQNNIKSKITLTNVRDFLKHIRENSNEADAIAQLLALFSAFRKSNSEIATLVYEDIIDKMLKNPVFFDDDLLITKLKKFEKKESILKRKLALLESGFNTCLLQQTASSFSTVNYQVIEDAWSTAMRHIVNLNEIIAIETGFPHDKHSLRGQIAKSVFAQSQSFNLNNFLAAIEVETSLETDAVTDYERMLIETLVTIDNEILRADILDRLKNKYSQHEWVHKTFGNQSVYLMAVLKGNVGLITWLTVQQKPKRVLVGQMSLFAAQAQQWDVVNYLCTLNKKPKPSVLAELLSMAAAEGQIKTIKLICEQKEPPSKQTIEQAFIKAVENNQAAAVTYFTHMEKENAPCPSIQAKALKLAAHKGYTPILKILTAISESLITAAIEQSLVAAVKAESIDVLKVLCSSQQTLRMSALEKAFLLAVDLGCVDRVKVLMGLELSSQAIAYGLFAAVQNEDETLSFYLCSLEKQAPSQKCIDLAFEKAIKNESLKMVRFLCTLKSRSPSASAVDHGYVLAAKSGLLEMVSYLSTESPIKPRGSAINQALIQAASAGKEDTTGFICKTEKPTAKNIDQALQAGVKAHSLSTVKILSGLSDDKSNKKALQRASSSGFKDISDFLRAKKNQSTGVLSQSKVSDFSIFLSREDVLPLDSKTNQLTPV